MALITDMEQPLGRTIGNALEIRECIEFLNGDAAGRPGNHFDRLAAHMIRLGGAAKTQNQAYKLAL